MCVCVCVHVLYVLKSTNLFFFCVKMEAQVITFVRTVKSAAFKKSGIHSGDFQLSNLCALTSPKHLEEHICRILMDRFLNHLTVK